MFVCVAVLLCCVCVLFCVFVSMCESECVCPWFRAHCYVCRCVHGFVYVCALCMRMSVCVCMCVYECLCVCAFCSNLCSCVCLWGGTCIDMCDCVYIIKNDYMYCVIVKLCVRMWSRVHTRIVI